MLAPVRRFDCVIIDKAGHASEPELLAAIVDVLEPKRGKMVLAGDPRQLGPLIQAKQARALEISLLERLCMAPSPYAGTPYSVRDDGTFDTTRVCMLTKNYRSHGCITDISSRLFYFGRLETYADPIRANTFIGWDALPNPNFPIVFEGVVGEELREANSPSWFNPDEIILAGEWIKKVLDRLGTGITASDIAVVTPYHKQKMKTTKHLEAKGISGVTVGSPEMLQGQEFAVVIITTTRSDMSHLTFDVRHRLGFMANSKRFNVALTRAKSLLVVIGNPFVLAHDRNWRELINECTANDAYVGCDFDGKPAEGAAQGNDEEMVEGIDKMSQILDAAHEEAFERAAPRDNE